MNEGSSKTPAEGFSSDGYIINQDCFSSVRYRTITSDMNGCGWIAAYDLRRALGHTVSWEEVLAELDSMHRLRIPGPTLMRFMREYLDRYVPGWVETAGREEAIAAALESRAGIFRYQEEHVPHFVCFIRQEDGNFRFFNVADGLEDSIMPMERFAREHLTHGTVIALTVPNEQAPTFPGLSVAKTDPS